MTIERIYTLIDVSGVKIYTLLLSKCTSLGMVIGPLDLPVLVLY
jgi:hypothetical protein